MDPIGHISDFGDRGGLNGLRVSEDILIQHSRVPFENGEKTPELRRRVGFKGEPSKDNNDDNDEGYSGPKGNVNGSHTTGAKVEENSTTTKTTKTGAKESETTKSSDSTGAKVSDSTGGGSSSTDPNASDSFWSKIQKWFKNHAKGTLIAALVIAIIIVIITFYVLNVRKKSNIPTPGLRESFRGHGNNNSMGASLMFASLGKK